MPPIEQLKSLIEALLPGVELEIVPNPASPAPASLAVQPSAARAVAQFLRDEPSLRLDYCSGVTGVDWPDKVEKIKGKARKIVAGVEQEVEETVERTIPGRLEAVYFLYSMALKHGPVVLRQRTANRTDQCRLASLTPVWRSCEFQEREVFDLFGIHFEDHPDLRRILMWDGYADHPMRKDYVEPDDYEYEPTPHDEVLERAKAHYPVRPEGAP